VEEVIYDIIGDNELRSKISSPALKDRASPTIWAVAGRRRSDIRGLRRHGAGDHR
jgi:hypothetical protein